jgi:hypothetical protein
MGEAIQAYHGITAKDEFRNLEWLRSKTRHDEAQALGNAARKATAQADKKWQGVIAEKDTVIAEKNMALAEQAKLIAELQAKLK